MCLALLCSPGRKQSDKDTSAGMGSVVGDVRIAELGKPRLGEPSRIHIQIKESQEFKVSMRVRAAPCV